MSRTDVERHLADLLMRQLADAAAATPPGHAEDGDDDPQLRLALLRERAAALRDEGAKLDTAIAARIAALRDGRIRRLLPPRPQLLSWSHFHHHPAFVVALRGGGGSIASVLSGQHGGDNTNGSGASSPMSPAAVALLQQSDEVCDANVDATVNDALDAHHQLLVTRAECSDRAERSANHHGIGDDDGDEDRRRRRLALEFRLLYRRVGRLRAAATERVAEARAAVAEAADLRRRLAALRAAEAQRAARRADQVTAACGGIAVAGEHSAAPLPPLLLLAGDEQQQQQSSVNERIAQQIIVQSAAAAASANADGAMASPLAATATAAAEQRLAFLKRHEQQLREMLAERGNGRANGAIAPPLPTPPRRQRHVVDMSALPSQQRAAAASAKLAAASAADSAPRDARSEYFRQVLLQHEGAGLMTPAQMLVRQGGAQL